MPIADETWREVVGRIAVAAAAAARAKPLPARPPLAPAKPRRRVSRQAATVVDAGGEVVGTKWGDTACWRPRRPLRFSSIGADGSESTLRCRQCPGCRRFDRYQTCKRLAEHFHDYGGQLWELTFEVGEGVNVDNAKRRVAYALNACGRQSKSQGTFYRTANPMVTMALSSTSHLARSTAARLRASGITSLRFREIRRGHRDRFTPWSFRHLTAGLLARRGEEPGELAPWANRFYHAGLPQLQREPRTILTRQSIRDRHPEVHELARAWRAGVAIVLPEVLHPIERRRPRDRRGRFRRMSTIPLPLHSVLSRVLTGG